MHNSGRVKTPANSLSLNGHALYNKILLGLLKEECSAFLSKMEFVSLPAPTILNEIGKPIKSVFFLNSGLASVLSIMADGKTVEVGLCGKEGFVGIPLSAGLRSSPTRTIMQVDGSGFRIAAEDLVVGLREVPELAASLQRFAQEMALQASQVAACNRVHNIDERLARWLLMSQDRLGGDVIPLTQEFLAHMLGTRRASVTVAAGHLQKAGMIAYKRGSVKVENRSQLENACCECYKNMIQQIQKWRVEI